MAGRSVFHMLRIKSFTKKNDMTYLLHDSALLISSLTGYAHKACIYPKPSDCKPLGYCGWPSETRVFTAGVGCVPCRRDALPLPLRRRLAPLAAPGRPVTRSVPCSRQEPLAFWQCSVADTALTAQLSPALVMRLLSGNPGLYRLSGTASLHCAMPTCHVTVPGSDDHWQPRWEAIRAGTQLPSSHETRKCAL